MNEAWWLRGKDKHTWSGQQTALNLSCEVQIKPKARVTALYPPNISYERTLTCELTFVVCQRYRYHLICKTLYSQVLEYPLHILPVLN